MIRVALVRHGRRQDVEDPSWHLTAPRPDDPPLSPTGLRQARDVGAYLRDRQVAALFCSPFLRAIQTAQGIYEQTGLPFRVEAALGEWLNPAWFQRAPELATVEELRATYSGFDASYRSQAVVAYPEADEQVEVYARVHRFLQWLDAEVSGSVALVGHGASVTQAVRALCGSANGLDAKVGSVTEVLRLDGAWRTQGAGVQHLSVVIDE
jgi:broad specificity phosphatase PhoE